MVIIDFGTSALEMVVSALTLSLFVFGYGVQKQGLLSRSKGTVLLACYAGYTACLLSNALS